MDQPLASVFSGLEVITVTRQPAQTDAQEILLVSPMRAAVTSWPAVATSAAKASPVTLLAQNLLESSAVVTGGVLARLADRLRAPQAGFSGWAFADFTPLSLVLGAGPVDISIDLGSAQPVNAWALLNHNLAGITVSLFGDDWNPPVTADEVAPAGADLLRTFPPQTFRYWRLRVPAMTGGPRIGEFFLGVATTLAVPEYGSEESREGNVQRDESPAGFVWTVQKGAVGTRLTYRWPGMKDVDWTTLAAVFDQTLQSVKSFPMVDVDRNVRWIQFIEGSLIRRRIYQDRNEVAVTVEEAL
ncbi:MAG TPA: hypothetical protein VGV13_00955 [Methylomirabilota bacterium]|nr:hypothetical protein [Methylomirabilota bacterium]